MPKKRPGYHNVHITIPTDEFRVLQSYCAASVERLTATEIIRRHLRHYIKVYLTPRMAKGETASWSALNTDIPKVVAHTAHTTEPTAFPEPSND